MDELRSFAETKRSKRETTTLFTSHLQGKSSPQFPYEGVTLNRFMQLSLLAHPFEMDLPRPMLRPTEARTILKSRSGFIFHTAGEDIARLFMSRWQFPIDSAF